MKTENIKKMTEIRLIPRWLNRHKGRTNEALARRSLTNKSSGAVRNLAPAPAIAPAAILCHCGYFFNEEQSAVMLAEKTENCWKRLPSGVWCYTVRTSTPRLRRRAGASAHGKASFETALPLLLLATRRRVLNLPYEPTWYIVLGQKRPFWPST